MTQWEESIEDGSENKISRDTCTVGWSKNTDKSLKIIIDNLYKFAFCPHGVSTSCAKFQQN